MRYQIFYCLTDNAPFYTGVADVSEEYFDEFCRDKIIVKIIPYKIDFPPY